VDRRAIRVNASDGTHCAELHGQLGSDSADLVEARRQVVGTLSLWINRSIQPFNCSGGTALLLQCQCQDNQAGENCEEVTHSQSAFHAVAVSGLLTTTALLLIIGVTIWCCGQGDADGCESKPTLWTSHERLADRNPARSVKSDGENLGPRTHGPLPDLPSGAQRIF
jgi:hypothetical protein